MISTVIPTIGRDTLYTRAIPSVQAQTVTDWECIVVGDGVELDPVDDPRIRFLTIPKPDYPSDPHLHWSIGGVAAFNHGLDEARGEWVSYLADDDAYRPKHHELLLAAATDDVDVVYGQSVMPEEQGEQIYGNRWPLEPFDVVQGSYILRASLGHRAFIEPGQRGWDARWWTDLLERQVRTLMVKGIVHDYHPDPESLRFHRW